MVVVIIQSARLSAEVVLRCPSAAPQIKTRLSCPVVANAVPLGWIATASTPPSQSPAVPRRTRQTCRRRGGRRPSKESDGDARGPWARTERRRRTPRPIPACLPQNPVGERGIPWRDRHPFRSGAPQFPVRQGAVRLAKGSQDGHLLLRSLHELHGNRFLVIIKACSQPGSLVPGPGRKAENRQGRTHGQARRHSDFSRKTAGNHHGLDGRFLGDAFGFALRDAVFPGEFRELTVD